MSQLVPYRHQLKWSRPAGGPRPTPDGIDRHFLPTPDGLLDIHFAKPALGTGSPALPPLLFVHGGFGSALCYQNYIRFFAAHGYPSYSVSLRGHGDSFNPGYLRMYFTSRQTFILDASRAIQFVRDTHGGADPIVFGHSSGGGVLQDLVAQGKEKVRELALLGAIPGYGSFGVNSNWLRFDPWFSLRMFLLHFFHPRSPLSSTTLVHRAFFSPEMPTEKVVEVEKTMPEYESMSWPLGMLRQFVNPFSVLRNLGLAPLGSPTARREPGRILIVAGEKDQLVTLDLKERLKNWYTEAAITTLAKVRLANQGHESGQNYLGGEVGELVSIKVAPGVGHHIMLDVRWKESAEMVLQWLQQRYHT